MAMMTVDYTQAYLKRIPRGGKGMLPVPIPSWWGHDTHSGWHTLLPIEQPRFAGEAVPPTHYLLGWNEKTGQLGTWDADRGVCTPYTGPEPSPGLLAMYEGKLSKALEELNGLSREFVGVERELGPAYAKSYKAKILYAGGLERSRQLLTPFLNAIERIRQELIQVEQQACDHGAMAHSEGAFQLTRQVLVPLRGRIHAYGYQPTFADVFVQEAPGAVWEEMKRRAGQAADVIQTGLDLPWGLILAGLAGLYVVTR